MWHLLVSGVVGAIPWFVTPVGAIPWFVTPVGGRALIGRRLRLFLGRHRARGLLCTGRLLRARRR